MLCPICSNQPIPSDANVIDKKFKDAILQGKVYAVIPSDSTYSPYKHLATVTITPRNDKVKYLKFESLDEIKNLGFFIGETYTFEGHIHEVSHNKQFKELVFQVRNVRPVSKD